MNTMTKPWSDSLVLKFLDIYEKHECLWNPNLDEYKYKDARDLALNSMVQQMELPNLTTIDIKNKIKSIRTTYKRELTSVLKSEESSDHNDGTIRHNYEPKLFWYKKADSFLNAVSSHAKRKSSISKIKQDVNSVIQHQEITDEIIEEMQDEEDLCNDEEELNSTIQISLKREIIENAIPDRSQTSSKRSRYSTETSPQIIQREQQNSTQTFNYNTDDEFEIFGRSIAAQLRRMPLYDAIMCQEKLQSVLTQSRLSSFSNC